MKALDTRTAWRIAFSAWRKARRDLSTGDNLETASNMATLMRRMSGSWDLPHPGGRWIDQYEAFNRGIYRWHGPYRSGRDFLRRLNEAEKA